MKKILFFLLIISQICFGQSGKKAGVYNVKDFGLNSDSTADNTTVFRAMLAWLPNGANVYFPQGKYRFSDSVKITKDIFIFGDGQSYVDSFYTYNTLVNGATNLYFTSATKDFLIIDTPTTGKRAPVIQIEYMSIINTNYLSTAGNALTFKGDAKKPIISFVTFKGFFNQINSISAINTMIDNCIFWAPAKKAMIQNNTAQPDAGGLFFTYNMLFAGQSTANPPDTALMIHGGGGVLIDHCDFNAQQPFSTTTQWAVMIASDWTGGLSSDVFITNNIIENYRHYGIYLDNVNALNINFCHIVSNTIGPYSSGANLTKNAIWIKRHGYSEISGNTGNIGFTTGYAFIRIDSCDHINLVGNVPTTNWTGGIDSVTHTTFVSPRMRYETSQSSLLFSAVPSGNDFIMYNVSAASAGSAPLLIKPTGGNNLMIAAIAPTGSATQTEFEAYNSSSSSNFNYMAIGVNSTSSYLNLQNVGSATALPFKLFVGAFTVQVSTLGDLNGIHNLQLSGNISDSNGSINTQNILLKGSTSSGIQMWKDATPTKAANIGMYLPGNTNGDDIVFSTYNGSTWSGRMYIKNGGNVLIGSSTDQALGPVQSTSTTGPQYSSIYDATHHTELTTNASGVFGIAPSGSTTAVTGALSTTTTLSTGDPGSGSGLWLLGTLQTATVVLDTTRYIEVKIGATVYKVLVAQ